jgi:hypothetical protein
MTKSAFPFALFSTVLVCCLPAPPAQAQTRAFVSAAGSDSNNCINTNSPCRHFQAAYNALPTGGEIDVLDPGNYGALTVTHTLSIVGRGWATLSPISGTAAITINSAASDTINISGVALDGAHLANTTGIQFNSGGSLTIADSLIRNFTSAGVRFEPTNAGNLYVSKTRVTDNNNGASVAWGIYVHPAALATVFGILEGVEMVHNYDGLGVDASNGAVVYVSVANSVAGNSVPQGSGMYAVAGSGFAFLDVRSSNVSNNDGYGLLANGTASFITVSKTSIHGNGLTSTAIGSGSLSSFGDNDAVGLAPTSTSPLN